MLTKNFTTAFSFLLLAASVGSAHAGGNTVTAPSTETAGVVDVQVCDKPAYPVRWINDGASGDVVMDVLVSPDGTVLESKLVQSSGYRRVDNASVRAVEHCKLKVTSTQGSPTWSRLKYAWVIE